jgi:hypothetical protein
VLLREGSDLSPDQHLVIAIAIREADSSTGITADNRVPMEHVIHSTRALKCRTAPCAPGPK